jgi:dephospho-CoA kinase
MKIAITGGIGSGKSTVAKYFKEQGYNVFSCDEIYSDLLNDDSFLKKIETAFGDVIDNNGKLDREKLAKKVFNDSKNLKLLNSITHPQIMNRAVELMENHKLSFCEVPLLFVGGFENLFDNVIVVMRDKQKRAEAVSKRDNISIENANLRIKNQFDYDKLQKERYIPLYNNSGFAELLKECERVLAKIKEYTF